jgi:hypothetical protein
LFRADLLYYHCGYREALKLYTELLTGGLLKSAAQKRDVGEAVARTLSMLGRGFSCIPKIFTDIFVFLY